MAYINLATNQYPLSEQDIKRENPNTSYPAPFNPPGYAWIFPVPQPVFDQYSQKCVELAPEVSDKGNWQQVWQVSDLTGEELAEAQARKAADESARRAAMSITPRQCRLQLLATPFSEGVTGLDAVEQAISSMDKSAQIDWEHAEVIKRDYPLVVGIQTLFSWSDTETDTFFTEATKL